MANIVQVRVELKNFGKGDYFDRDKAHRIMVAEFRRKCQDVGIARLYKDHQYFESDARKSRRKRKESQTRLQLDNLERKIRSGEPVPKNNRLYKKLMQQKTKSKHKREDKNNF